MADPIAGYGLNHACGTAVDSEGDIYVSNAGEAKIEVFDHSGVHLASIPDANQPCGLAVDSAGRLYVTDSATGSVVRYLPDTYPFFGVPTYGAPATIDASGKAKGIAVDQTDDSLYVAEGDRVAMYSSEGTLGVNELQLVQAPGTGTYKIAFKGQETVALPAGASHAEVQAALESLSTIGPGNVSVSQYAEGEGDAPSSEHLIAFTGALAGVNVEQVGCSCSFVHTIKDGEAGIIAEGEVSGATGIASYTYNSPSHRVRYISVAEPAADEIKIFVGGFANEPAGFRPATVESRHTIDGTETPAGELGLASTGAYLGVDRGSGHLYAFDATHGVINEFEADGHFFARTSSAGFSDAQPSAIAVYPQVGEIQTVRVDEDKFGVEGGTYTLSFGGLQTEPIIPHTDAAPVQSALEALATIGPGNVKVERISSVYWIRFTGTLADRNLEQVGCDPSGLGGTTKRCTVATRQDGDGAEGRLYVSAGAGSGAKLLAFGSVELPSRNSFGEPLSHHLTAPCGTAVDSRGDVYAAGQSEIKVYDPEGTPIEVIDSEGNKGKIVSDHPCTLAVDSKGNLYVEDEGKAGAGKEKLVVYKPSVYPFSASSPPSYGALHTIDTVPAGMTALAVNPANDHLFVKHLGHPVSEYASLEAGSSLLNSDFCGLGAGTTVPGIGVYSATGDVYIVNANETVIDVCDPTGSKVLGSIDGSGSPAGPFTQLNTISIAVDQSDGHVLVGDMATRGVVDEYETAGAFVGQYGTFTTGFLPQAALALDNSCVLHSPRLTEATSPKCREFDPSNGNLYVADPDPNPSVFSLTALGPVAYGEPPAVVTGTAGEINGGSATLSGTVDPRGFEVTACRFEYLTDTQYIANGETFSGAIGEPCAESLGAIGKGTGPVAVHATLNGLIPKGRYRFRLVAEDKYGPSEGRAGLFGPPVVTVEGAQPILYDEATLRGRVDPSGLVTSYRFEYGPGTGEYDHSTPAEMLSAGAGPAEVQAFLAGLAEGTPYHYRLVAENEVGVVEGEDQTLTTQQRRQASSCPNATRRLEDNSTTLPDCRGYELVTPADTRGGTPRGEEDAQFNNWLVTPLGPRAGESVAFFLRNTLPGTEGDGLRNGFRATRDAETGWSSALFSPSAVQTGETSNAFGEGVSADQLYSFWHFVSTATPPGAFPPGDYLRTPDGFEAIGRGSLGEDLGAVGRYISAGGSHMISVSTKHLEDEAAPEGTAAIYDRSAGASSARVVSIKPDGSPFGAGQGAVYQGVAEDGSAVVFETVDKLYLRQNDVDTLEVASGPSSFAGISRDGKKVFYANATSSAAKTPPGELFVFDTEGQSTTRIAVDAQFVNVSGDGSHVYFLSEDEIGGEGIAGKPNLFVWGDAGTRLVATLDAKDFAEPREALDLWAAMCVNSSAAGTGLSHCPSRTTTDGRFLVFQSHVDLALPYEGRGHSEIYRYDAQVGSLVCVSCDPSGVPASADAELESVGFTDGATAESSTVIPNVTDDGGEVFFQTTAALLPEDANSVLDVYEWQALGVGGCTRPEGCLALISSGQGEDPSTLYSMTPDGHDVFFSTLDQLVGSDIAGSPSIYDARVDGGFANPVSAAPCQGDACQGKPSVPPSLSSPTTVAIGAGNEVGEAPSKSAGMQRSLTRAQKLARALKVCKRKPKRLRRRCEAQARKRYGAKTSKRNRRNGK